MMPRIFWKFAARAADAAFDSASSTLHRQSTRRPATGAATSTLPLTRLIQRSTSARRITAADRLTAVISALEQLEADLFGFQQAVDSDQELQVALGNKQASEEGKLALVDALIKGKASAESAVLIRRAVSGAGRRRVAVVLEQFGKQVSAYAERLVATVTVANPLSAAQLKRLEAALSSTYGAGIRVNVEQDSAILGGLKVQVAGQIIDGSLSSRLHQAKLQLA